MANGLRIHHREQQVIEAESKLRGVLLEIMKSDLTEGEFLQVVGNVLAGELRSMAKYMIRRERHGNKDIPGGLEDG